MVLRNMFSMTGLSVAKAGASIAVSTLMAGLVPPEQYGLVSFAIPLMMFITLLTDLGLTSAIVRHPSLTKEQAGAVIGAFGCAGIAGAILLGLSAPVLERRLVLPGLTPVLLGFALVTAFSIWATAPRALLERRLAYQRIAAVEISALAGALMVFVLGVAASLGIQALVVFHIVLQGGRAIFFQLNARPLFELNFQLKRIAELARVSGWVFVSNLLAYSARNVDRLLIGGVLGAASLGLYSLGYQFMTVPLILITWPVSGVLMSTLARLGSDQGRKADLLCAVLTGTAAVSFPMMTFLIIGTRFPVEHLLSARWHGVSDVIAILAPVGAVQSIAAYNGAVLVERGMVRLNFRLALLSSLSLCGVFVATVFAGLRPLVIAYAVVSIGVSAIMTFYMCRVAGVGIARFGRCLFPGAAASVGGALVVAAIGGVNPRSMPEWIMAVLAFAIAVVATYAIGRRHLLHSFHAVGRASAALSVLPG